MPFSIHIPVTCELQLVAFLMKFSNCSETNRAGYKMASNTRMSSWLIYECGAPGAALEPGSGSGTLEGSQSIVRVGRPRWMLRAGRCSHASVNALRCTPGRYPAAKQVHVKLCWLAVSWQTTRMWDFVRKCRYTSDNWLAERNTHDFFLTQWFISLGALVFSILHKPFLRMAFL